MYPALIQSFLELIRETPIALPGLSSPRSLFKAITEPYTIREHKELQIPHEDSQKIVTVALMEQGFFLRATGLQILDLAKHEDTPAGNFWQSMRDVGFTKTYGDGPFATEFLVIPYQSLWPEYYLS